MKFVARFLFASAIVWVSAQSFATENTAEKSANQADPAALMERGKQLATTTCVACHGADGNSPTPAFPKIAGQHSAYLFKQMREFKGEGNVTKRDNAIMAGQVAALSQEDMKAASIYFSSQSLKPETASKPEWKTMAEKIYRGGDASRGLAACAGCHGPAGLGIPAQYPRISGQYPDYIKAQLVAFRSGARANDPEMMMRHSARYLTDAEIDALADYVAGLRLQK